MLVRDIRLNIPSIRRDGDIPVLSVIRQKIHVGEHRSGILGAETDDVDHGRVEAVAADLMRVIGVADADKAFPQPVRKPLGIKCRNICSLSGVDDHIALPADFRGLALLLVCCFCNTSVMGVRSLF